MSQVATIDINKVRDLVMQVARHQQVPEDSAEDARETIRMICKEASQHGLTTADVVRAIFRPVLETRTRGCNCPTCRARRAKLHEEHPAEVNDLVNQSSSPSA